MARPKGSSGQIEQTSSSPIPVSVKERFQCAPYWTAYLRLREIPSGPVTAHEIGAALGNRVSAMERRLHLQNMQELGYIKLTTTSRGKYVSDNIRVMSWRNITKSAQKVIEDDGETVNPLNEMVSYFRRAHKKATGIQYTFTGKDHKNARRLLERVEGNLETMQRLIDTFMTMPDDSRSYSHEVNFNTFYVSFDAVVAYMIDEDTEKRYQKALRENERKRKEELKNKPHATAADMLRPVLEYKQRMAELRGEKVAN